jgi:hypothetical protein
MSAFGPDGLGTAVPTVPADCPLRLHCGHHAAPRRLIPWVQHPKCRWSRCSHTFLTSVGFRHISLTGVIRSGPVYLLGWLGRDRCLILETRRDKSFDHGSPDR